MLWNIHREETPSPWIRTLVNGTGIFMSKILAVTLLTKIRTGFLSVFSGFSLKSQRNIWLRTRFSYRQTNYRRPWREYHCWRRSSSRRHIYHSFAQKLRLTRSSIATTVYIINQQNIPYRYTKKASRSSQNEACWLSLYDYLHRY